MPYWDGICHVAAYDNCRVGSWILRHIYKVVLFSYVMWSCSDAAFCSFVQLHLFLLQQRAKIKTYLKPASVICSTAQWHVLSEGLSHLIFFHVSLFWIYISKIYIYVSYTNSPVSLLLLLPVYGVSNRLLFGTSRYWLIELLILVNHHDISKLTPFLSENQFPNVMEHPPYKWIIGH